jgi:deoxyribonuclease V
VTLNTHAPFAVLDAHYSEGADCARAACVVAAGWTDDRAIEEWVTETTAVRPYRSGHFFERELPSLMEVLAFVRAQLRAIVIDGYVDLDEAGRAGLGAHLFEHLASSIPVIGVAKRMFRGASFARVVRRGESKASLFVTGRGISPALAAELIASMHGPFRIPTLLTRVDQLARGLVAPMPHLAK